MLTVLSNIHTFLTVETCLFYRRSENSHSQSTQKIRDYSKWLPTDHWVLHSQCESKNMRTSPVAASAPAKRARIKPLRSLVRTSFTTPSGHVSLTYFSSFSPSSAASRLEQEVHCSHILASQLSVASKSLKRLRQETDKLMAGPFPSGNSAMEQNRMEDEHNYCYHLTAFAVKMFYFLTSLLNGECHSND